MNVHALQRNYFISNLLLCHHICNEYKLQCIQECTQLTAQYTPSRIHGYDRKSTLRSKMFIS